MEFTVILNIWLLAILLGLSAFFSSSETALFSLGKLALERIRINRQKTYKYVNILLSQPRRTLITILVGNELINGTFSVVMAYVVYKVAQGRVPPFMLPVIPVLFSWPLLVFFGEIIPKTVAVRSPDRISSINSKPLHYFSMAIYPARILVKAIVDIIARPFLGKKGKQDTLIDEDFFKVFIEMGREEGVLEADEKELIDRVFVLDDILVEQIMTPESEMASIPIDITYPKLLEFIKRERYSRIPVYSKDPKEKVIGILNVKDLLGHAYSETERFKEFLRRNIKNPIFVASKTRIIDLLKDFQLRRTHMGIVVDERGETIGLVTLEDVLEELFGEIKDEYDVEEKMWQKVGEGEYKFDLRLTAGRFSEILDYDLPKGDYRTVGQLLEQILGHRPVGGEEIMTNRFGIKIIQDKSKLFVLVREKGKKT